MGMQELFKILLNVFAANQYYVNRIKICAGFAVIFFSAAKPKFSARLGVV
jgi:hypothetical protein